MLFSWPCPGTARTGNISEQGGSLMMTYCLSHKPVEENDERISTRADSVEVDMYLAHT